jgi:hypothetical protein
MQAALMNQNRRLPPMFQYGGGFNPMQGGMPMRMGGGNFIPNMNRRPFEQRGPPQAGGMIPNQSGPRPAMRPTQNRPYGNNGGNFGGQKPQGGAPGQGGMSKPYGGPQGGRQQFQGGNNNFPQERRNQPQGPRDSNGGQQQSLADIGGKPKDGLITTGTSGLTIGDLKKKWSEFIQLDKDKQRNILGELLFPLIRDQVGEKVAPKITGMLIDLDVLEINDILEFLEDKDLLTERIKEANELIESESQ